MCLDVLRAMGREPEAVEAFFDEVGLAAGQDPRLDRFAESIRAELADFAEIEVRARHIVERLAKALQASLLVRHGDPAVADAFCASRLPPIATWPSARCRAESISNASSSALDRRRAEGPFAVTPPCGRSHAIVRPAKRLAPARRAPPSFSEAPRRGTCASASLRPAARMVYNVGRFANMPLDSLHPHRFSSDPGPSPRRRERTRSSGS